MISRNFPRFHFVNGMIQFPISISYFGCCIIYYFRHFPSRLDRIIGWKCMLLLSLLVMMRRTRGSPNPGGLKLPTIAYDLIYLCLKMCVYYRSCYSFSSLFLECCQLSANPLEQIFFPAYQKKN